MHRMLVSPTESAYASAMLKWTAIVLVLIAACASKSSSPPKNGSGSAAPPQDTAMNARASIYPADQLLAWLERHRSDPAKLGGEIELRLPVYVTLTENKIDIKTATVGDQPQALPIKVNDSTLNIPVAGKLPMFFGEGADKGMLWLVGYWRGGQIKEFQVTRVGASIKEPERTTANFVEIAQ
jgi:hypothetical protein